MSETWFSKWYDTLMGPLEKRWLQQIRKNLIGKAQGKVLEIGSGTGVNFPYYQQAKEVFALEPNSIMRDKSMVRAEQAAVPIEVISGNAELLPFRDNTFDTVVGTLVLCTIPDPAKALTEIRRVCKPEGNILFFEHVRMDESIFGFLQDWLTPLWKRVCDGCHLNRHSLCSIKQAGFKIVRLERYCRNLFLVVEAKNKKEND